MCTSSSSSAKPASPSSPAVNSNGHVSHDPSWLKIDVCKDFLASQCCMNEEDCPFAHPEPRVQHEGERVTCCFDYIKDRCQRENCRYYHPPAHIKERLKAAGKMHAQKRNKTRELSASAANFQPMNPPPGAFNENSMPGPQLPYGLVYCLKMEVCREFLRGRCHRFPAECRFAHPTPQMLIDVNNMTMVCHNYSSTGSTGNCNVNGCPYFHLLPHHKSQVAMIPGDLYSPQRMMASNYMAMGSYVPSVPSVLLPSSPTHQQGMVYQPGYMPFYPGQVMMGYHQQPPMFSPSAALWTPPLTQSVRPYFFGGMGPPPVGLSYGKPCESWDDDNNDDAITNGIIVNDDDIQD